MELISPGLGLVFWMIISFSIVVFVLGKFAWKPILKSIKDREQSIENALQAAEKAKEEMKALIFNNEKLKKEAIEERDALLSEARKIKDAIIEAKNEIYSGEGVSYHPSEVKLVYSIDNLIHIFEVI